MRVRTEAKRSDIMEIAAGVFLEQGFARTSMSEIAARLGGSKTTLYGYFRSKEELFVEVVVAEAVKHLLPTFADLDETFADLRDALIPLGEKLVTFLLSPDAIAAHRMVMSEAGRSNIGQHFYLNGRQRGLELIAAFLERAAKIGKIKTCDYQVAATHLLALIEGELLPPVLFGLARPAPTRLEIRESMERAVDVFLTAYAAQNAKAEPISMRHAERNER
jgi:AcrR family transcriptional regulator